MNQPNTNIKYLRDYLSSQEDTPQLDTIWEALNNLEYDLMVALDNAEQIQADLATTKALLKEASDEWVPHYSKLSAKIVDLLHIPPPSPWRDRDD